MSALFACCKKNIFPPSQPFEHFPTFTLTVANTDMEGFGSNDLFWKVEKIH